VGEKSHAPFFRKISKYFFLLVLGVLTPLIGFHPLTLIISLYISKVCIIDLYVKSVIVDLNSNPDSTL